MSFSLFRMEVATGWIFECSLPTHVCRCASWGGPLAAAVYLPLITVAPLPPLSEEDAWMDQLQARLWLLHDVLRSTDTTVNRCLT